MLAQDKSWWEPRLDEDIKCKRQVHFGLAAASEAQRRQKNPEEALRREAPPSWEQSTFLSELTKGRASTLNV